MSRKNGYRYRCARRSCRARVTLPRKMEQYARPPRCHSCGCKQLTLDVYRHRVELHKSRTCHCSGYPFPHRTGCQPWCINSKRLPTEQERADRYGTYDESRI